MRLGVEDHLVKVQRLRRCEKQIEIFECLGEEEALHGIGFFFRHHALQRGVTFVGAAVFDEVAPHHLAHLQIMIWVKLRARFV